MKKTLSALLVILIMLLIYTKRNEIIKEIMIRYIDKDIKFEEPNLYYKPYDYEFVKNTDNLYPKTKQDILNIIYTTLNRGQTRTIFYCEYEECIKDVNEIAENIELLSNINNLVHPYNSYSNIYFTINKYKRIELQVKKQYSDSEILLINNKLDSIISKLSINTLDEKEKIKTFHDYIINNTKYDKSIKNETEITIYTNSNKATGLLFEKIAVCSGYSDTMAIFLSKYGFNNYKISSSKHIWNLIYIDNSWKHIDATWDDPITIDGKDVLLHDFFLIDTNTLLEKEQKLEQIEHNYDKEIYKEANQS